MDKRLLALARAHRSQLAALTGIHAVSAALIVAQAAAFASIVSLIHVGGGELADAPALLLMLAAVIVGRVLLAYTGTAQSAAFGRAIKVSLRVRLVRDIAARGYAHRGSDRTGSILAAAGEGTEAIEPFFRDLLPAVLQAVLVPAAVLCVVAPIDLLSAAILVVTAPLIPLLGALIGRAAGAQARRRYADMSRLSAHFYDVLQGLVTLKLFNRSRPQRTTIAEVTRAFRESTMSVLRTAFLSAFMLELIATLSIAVLAVEIGLRLLHGGIDFGHALFVLVVAPEFYTPIRQLAARFHNSANSTAAAEKLFALMPATNEGPVASTHIAPAHMGRITFEAVSYTYGSGRPALEQLTFSVERGEYVAITGPSGAGKSTLAALLMGFITPQSGRVTIDGTPLADVDIELWRRLVGYMPQRPHLFDATIADNVRLGAPDASDTAVWEALARAGADRFIRDLAQGINTLCGERGIRFSGGQAHRIALARALIRNAPLLLLDEPTAHLDASTERAIADALSARPAGTTVIHIAHRTHAISGADRIIALAEGRRVLAEGAHTADGCEVDYAQP